MDRLKNLSIRKTAIVYILISLVAGFLMWAAVCMAASRKQTQLFWKYTDMEISYNSAYPNEFLPGRPDIYLMSDRDRFILELCDFFTTYGLLVFTIPGIITAITMFYRHKIYTPLRELSVASRQIAENNLDFHVTYQNKDELGQLCVEFEKMRAELEANSRRMWHMMEEEKILRAAIAHDIRTPLATLRGYQEMLLEFLPQGTLSQEQTEEMLHEGMEQIDRLSHFVETMRRLSGLEAREIMLERTDLAQLEDKIQKSVQTLTNEYGRFVSIAPVYSDRAFQSDTGLILEVAENLISNALRFANKQVLVRLFLEGDRLILEVADDGAGYSKDLLASAGAYRYRNNDHGQSDQQHLGLGLYISRLFCEKHGGNLILDNLPEGGAKARAVFQINSKRQ